MKPTVALIYGGVDGERDVSLAGGRFVRGLIDREKYSVIEILIEKDGSWHLNNSEASTVYPAIAKGASGIMSQGELLTVDVAFPLLHGALGEDGILQGALECAAIPYVGARVPASVLCHNKVYTKIIAESLGIPVARWLYVPKDLPPGEAQRRAERKLGYPMFIKPAEGGSSIGAGKASDRRDFTDAFLTAAQSSENNVLIEEEITQKREIELGYFSALGNTIISGGGEILTEEFYSFDKKYLADQTETTPRAAIGKKEALLLKKYAKELCETIGIRHIARIDFFLTEGRILLNEINTMPGFTPTSLYARMLESEGIPPNRLINALIEDAYREGKK